MMSTVSNIVNVKLHKVKVYLAESYRSNDSEAKGDIRVQVETNKRKHNIRNILCVLSLRANLLSVRQLYQSGY